MHNEATPSASDRNPDWSFLLRTPAVEDPIRISRFTERLAALGWVQDQLRTSLTTVFSELSALAQAELRYYYLRRDGSRKLSRLCRLGAWSLGSLGILVPLLHPVLEGLVPKNFLSWGYVAFGIAGVILVADNVFAGTQAHQRYVRAQLEIEKIYTVFALEWQALMIKHDSAPSADSASALLARAIEFSTAFHGSMGSETAEWQKAMNDGLAELKGKISAANGKK
jgi:hypothetical protein